MKAHTVAISRHPHSTGAPDIPDRASSGIEERQAIEEKLADALRADGCRVLMLPHIYYLMLSHQAISRLKEIQEDIILGAWLYPRAVYWTLKAHGIKGNWLEAAEVTPKTGGGSDCVSTEQERTITCVDLASFSSLEACVGEFRRAADLASADEPVSEPGSLEEVSDEGTSRWYPVLDYSRCAGCKQCFNFCLFGVYALEEDRVVAVQPDNCKPGCAACARVCPQGAIMFPHYWSDPAIAGAPGAEIAGELIDLGAFFQPRNLETVARPRSPVSGSAEPSLQGSGSCKRDKSSPDDLEDLIDALDELDE